MTASLTNQELGTEVLGEYTIAELATLTLDEIGDKEFDTKYLIVTNQAKS